MKMKKIIIWIIIIIILSGINSMAQIENSDSISNLNEKDFIPILPDKHFIISSIINQNKTYGGGDDDRGYSIIQTFDEGYITAGYTSSYGNGDEDAWIVKIDSQGNELWNKTYGGEHSDGFSSIIQSNNEEFVCCGYTSSYGNGDKDAWIVKIDSQGNELWNKTCGGEFSDRFYHLQQTVDGSYILTGYTSENASSNQEDTWLVKISNNGNIIWKRVFGGYYYDYGGSVKQTSDEGFIIIGLISHDPDLYNADIYLIKTNEIGEVIWSKTLGGPCLEYGTDIIQLDDQGFLLSSVSQQYDEYASYDGNIDLIKINQYGDEEWIKSIGDPYHHDFGDTILKTNDNGYIIIGSKIDFSSANCQVTSIKCDNIGNIEWANSYGGMGEDVGVDVVKTFDGNFILTGYTGSYGSGDKDIWIIWQESFVNNPPFKPDIPIGTSDGKIKRNYEYKASTSDPDNDDLFYLFDWGDKTYSDWLGPFNSGEVCQASHSWNQIDEYNIRVKVKDVHGGESEWSDPLSISMPKNNFNNFLNFFNFIKNLLLSFNFLIEV
jgi:hypothetical protein